MYYVDLAYDCFCDDFLKPNRSLLYNGLPVNIPTFPAKDNYNGAFWHFVSKENEIGIRMYDLERCVRIPWIRPIIENSNDDSVCKWRKKVKKKERHILWLFDEYIVVLEERKTKMLLWTAYVVEYENQIKKLIKDCKKHRTRACNKDRCR